MAIPTWESSTVPYIGGAYSYTRLAEGMYILSYGSDVIAGRMYLAQFGAIPPAKIYAAIYGPLESGYYAMIYFSKSAIPAESPLYCGYPSRYSGGGNYPLRLSQHPEGFYYLILPTARDGGYAPTGELQHFATSEEAVESFQQFIGVLSDNLASRLSIFIDYPNAGDSLATTAGAVSDVETGIIQVSSIAWSPADTNAEQLTSYQVTLTLTGTDIRFNTGITPNIINSGQYENTYVQGVSRPVFDPQTPNVITYTITFGPTGIKDPYAVDRDEESDQVPDPALPALAATSTGFLAIYQPTLSQLKQLATYMWSDSFIDTLKKLVSDPFQTILGLSIVPVQAPSGGSSNVILGNVDTGIAMPKVATQYVTVNCGTLALEEKYRSYLDYNPNTKTWIYLPYIGIQAIDTDTIMNTSIEVIYKVDVLSGACLCNVLANGTVIGSYAGACASQLPITSMQFSSALTGLAQLTGGLVSVTVGSATGNIAASIVGGINAVQGTANIMKSNIEKSNRLGSTAGLMAVQYPYLIIQRPRQALPNAQNHYTGYPSFQTFTIGNLRGYTEVANIDLSGITATQKELDELKGILSEGVYF